VITRVLGTDPDVEVDVVPLEALPGDLFLLCSDGLTDMLRDDAIAAILRGADGPADGAEALVAAANAAGGDDNVTVVLFEVLEGDPPERPTPPAAPQPAIGAPDDAERPEAGGPTAETAAEPPAAPDDVRRHGASDGSRWPALLLLGAILLVGVLALWWGISR
jgi:protein phosphatase